MSESRTPATVNNISTAEHATTKVSVSVRKITTPNGPVAEIIGRKMAAALDPNLRPQNQARPVR
jgi:hypothetical protein